MKDIYRTPNRLDQKRKFPWHIIIKTLNVLKKERILKAVREEYQVTYKIRPVRITLSFPMETLKVRRALFDALQILKDQGTSPYYYAQ